MISKGDVVVIPFPFSDLSTTKRRPALVAATTKTDIVLCQITSDARKDSSAIPLSPKEFRTGGLRVPSLIRPTKLFTADRSLILYKAGSLTHKKVQEVENVFVQLFKK